MAIKLIISDRIKFPVKFTLNDGGEDKQFGVELSAKRVPLDKLQEDFKADMKIGEFLQARDLKMTAWIGKPALEDAESGEPLLAGPEALQALMDMVGGFSGLVYASLLEANGARGRSGN